MEEIAYAKINLALHVRAREPDNYHRIETLFAFCEDGDRLSVAPSAELKLEVRGPFASALSDGEDNLVLRAAEALRARYGVTEGAALLLDKQLPVAAGIGGGSADAAAALRLLARWWGLAADTNALLDLGRGLGADVPACVLSRTARGEGRGDRIVLTEEPGIEGSPILLVNPGSPLSTAAVFAAWDGIDRGPLPLLPQDWRNDLEPPATSLTPVVREVLAELAAQPGATLSRMSGSGATCFGLFEDDRTRDSAHARITGLHPGWWLLSSRLR